MDDDAYQAFMDAVAQTTLEAAGDDELAEMQHEGWQEEQAWQDGEGLTSVISFSSDASSSQGELIGHHCCHKSYHCYHCQHYNADDNDNGNNHGRQQHRCRCCSPTCARRKANNFQTSGSTPWRMTPCSSRSTSRPRCVPTWRSWSKLRWQTWRRRPSC